ncbi:putative ATPase [Sphingomonas kyeonggiensis]|uniref:ATP-dependent nuclease n=1 Tax=Sphingomonas kyeonggiensis TaxID=1268553 RepID=UPI00277D9EB9|nr:AAA family ATPase [Sphingomonas kyeonggiensis]MDQ0249253.1 putative ATPase [Sphingomonas kyeonggiensis]
MRILRKPASSSTANFALVSATLRCEERLAFNANDIVVLVGSNNSGKSTFLRGVKDFIEDSDSYNVIFSGLAFSSFSKAKIQERLESYYHILTDGNLRYVLDNRGSRDFYIHEDSEGPSSFRLRQGAGAFVSLLNSEKRLSLSNDVQTIDLLASKPRHPYHIFMIDPDKLASFSRNIEEAFGVGFTITRIGNPIRAYVGTQFRKSDTVSADQEIPKQGVSLLTQGDGLRSYIGMLAEIQAMSHPIVLLDEPEAFLHPPQARRFGRTLVREFEGDRQAFIATHSSHILQGILSGDTQRVRVIRLDRKSKEKYATVLENNQLAAAIDHPSVANSNLLDALFFEQAVVCEGDADCKIFDWIDRRKQPSERVDRFWYSAGGKHQVTKISALLNSFGVDWRVILDLDALQDWGIVSSLAKMKGLGLDGYKARINHALKNAQDSDLKVIREGALRALRDSCDDETALREASRAMEGRKLSSSLKRYGIGAFRNGQEREAVESLLSMLEDRGICLLRKGELESYAPTVGKHGPVWVSSVLETPAIYSEEIGALGKDIDKALCPLS